MLLDTVYNCIKQQEVMNLDKSRAEYFKKRRVEKGQFYAEIEKSKLNSLTLKLEEQQKTKTAWLNEKIDEEIGK